MRGLRRLHRNVIELTHIIGHALSAPEPRDIEEAFLVPWLQDIHYSIAGNRAIIVQERLTMTPCNPS